MYPNPWHDIWEELPENDDEVQSIEDLIYRKKNGAWVTVFYTSDHTALPVKIDYNPWTGEKLT